MNLNQDNINSFLNKYIMFVNEISDMFKYDVNIRHLLYLIVPAFIVKYGVNNESTVLRCFREVIIYVKSGRNNVVTASFNRILKKDSNGYYTSKIVMINNYSLSSFIEVFDNIVHELNHAVNSINNEISYDDNIIKIRTGLSTLNYKKSDLTYINKSDEVVLEEILNTSQVEEIIDIINSFSKFHIDNIELSNALYALKKEMGGSKYKSSAYSFQKHICSDLINNKTFAPTINNLRFKGFTSDISSLFDDVIGSSGSYKRLNKLLTEIHDLIVKYMDSKLLKKYYLSKIKDKALSVSSLIKEYESKCIYK